MKKNYENKNANERYQIPSKEEKKKWQYGSGKYKNVLVDEK